MNHASGECLIRRVVCNEDVWFFRLGARLGLYRRELTHSAIPGGLMAVPRGEMDYWQAELARMHDGTLEHGATRALFMHDSVHVRQMSAEPFWRWGLRYLTSKRFRRRIEEEAYTVHLAYLARCGVPLAADYWVGRWTRLYFGAFDHAEARAMFGRIVAAIRAQGVNVRVVDNLADAELVRCYAPWLGICGGEL